jgi:hypothetical protein
MTKLFKTLIVVLFVLFANINFSSAQQWSVTGNNISNSNTGNVGIGTSIPYDKLSIENGGLTLSSNSINYSHYYAIKPSSDNAYLGIGYHDLLNNWYPNNTIPAITLTYMGNVGIGTISAQTKLHVVNSANLGNFAGNNLALTRTENNVGNNFYVNDFTYREFAGNDWKTVSYIKGVSVDVSFLDPSTTLRSWIKQNPYKETIEFGSTGKTFMCIGNNVGIGTTTIPSSILQIVKSDATTNQNLSNSAALDIWNSNSGLNTGGQINFRSDANSLAAGIGAVIGYSNIGSTSAGSVGNLVFGVKNAATDGSVIPAMTIQHGGYVGIGNTIPSQALSVTGRIAIAPSGTYSDEGYNGALMITKPTTSGQYINLVRSNTNVWSLGTVYSSSTFAIGLGTSSDAAFTHPFFNIDTNGNVGIATTIPDSKLTVNGTIHATEVKVDLTVPADYVFKSGYKLMPLNEVEKYVKINSHLPEIPSAEEIIKDGLKMGEMQNKLLQKVEELTLYMIEQQKTINQQSAKIEELEKKLK